MAEPWPFRLADPSDPGRPPRPLRFWSAGQVARKRAKELAVRPRRLAVVDTHFPWVTSGFRYDEAAEVLRRHPETMFFSLFRMTDPFPAPVYPLEQFPWLAPASGVTDIHMVFLNLAIGALGLGGNPKCREVVGVRDDISLEAVLGRWSIRAHVTIYPGGGYATTTDASVLRLVSERCASVFTSVPEVEQAIPNAVPTVVPVSENFYTWRTRRSLVPGKLKLVFVGDDRPRKGMSILLEAMRRVGPGFELDVVGPHERHARRLDEVGARQHGWLLPDRLRDILWNSDVIVAPATRDLPSDPGGDPFFVDGFPTTAVRIGMLTGCCLVGSNPLGDHRVLRAARDYLEVPERDPEALADTLLTLRADPQLRNRIAEQGAETIRRCFEVRSVVADKLAKMGF